jgi:hypothetical protein
MMRRLVIIHPTTRRGTSSISSKPKKISVTFFIWGVLTIVLLLVALLQCSYLCSSSNSKYSSLDESQRLYNQRRDDSQYAPSRLSATQNQQSTTTNNNASSLLLQQLATTTSNNNTLPDFFIEYQEWHANQLKELKGNPDLWKDKKYLIMECYHFEIGVKYLRCGGLSDRLRNLPLLLWLAHKSERILFIAWTKPMPLELFLEPPPAAAAGGGKHQHQLDWRIPLELKPHLVGRKGVMLKMCKQSVATAGLSDRILRVNVGDDSTGSELFTKKTQLQYDDVFHSLFRSMFRPVPRLQAKLTAKLAAHELVEATYAAAHLRLRYKYYYTPTQEDIQKDTLHALQCASQAFPGAPILFATDYADANTVAQQIAQQYVERGLRVITLEQQGADADESSTSFLHFDEDQAWIGRKPEEYDSTFLDLLLLGESKCVSYGVGGYGLFGMRLSHGATSCGISRNADTHCAWKFDV